MGALPVRVSGMVLSTGNGGRVVPGGDWAFGEGLGGQILSPSEGVNVWQRAISL